MPNPTPVVPDRTQMRRYLDQGLTQARIVEQWEKDSGLRASRSAIAMAIGRYGLTSARPRERYMDTIPWVLDAAHMNAPDARLLRLEARVRRGKDLTPEEHRWWENWRAELNEKNAVIVYRAGTPEGFYWVPRTEEDGSDIIRRPESK